MPNKGRGGKRHGRNKYLRSMGVESFKDVDHALGEIGISVFRPPIDGSDLFDMHRFFSAAGKIVTLISRGDKGTKPMALSQVMKQEIRNNKPAYINVNAKEASNHIYDEIPSLRRQLTARLGRIGIFGSRNSSFLIVGVSLHEDEWQAVNDERKEIITALEDIARPPENFEFNWVNRRIPHVSLGKIDSSHYDEFRSSYIEPLKDVMPETITLQRATIHYTSSQRGDF